MARKILLAVWNDSAKPYEAFSEAKNSFFAEINNASVVERKVDGQIVLKDLQNNTVGSSALGGGLIGSLIGILGGPLGVLLGFSSGALIGSLIDVDEADSNDAVLTQVSRALPLGATGLLVDFYEDDERFVDEYFKAKGAILARWSYDEVEAEVEAATEAWVHAKKEANRVIHEEKKEANKAKRKAKWEEFKAKFS